MPRLIDMYDAALLDLDGTVYVGPQAVPHAVEALTTAARIGVRIVYTTNNAARTPEEVAAQLRGLGLELDDTDVLTSAQVGAHYIVGELGQGASVLPVGGPGVAIALEAAGLTVATSAQDLPVAVMQGYGPEVNWHDLAEASFAIAGGAVHVATNTDLSIPTARGIAPGNGTLVAAVSAATGTAPVVTGKPFRPMFDLAVDYTGARRALVIGDRLDTDIEGGHNAELDTLFVFTGVDGVAEILTAEPGRRPTHMGRDLRALFAPPAEVCSDDAGSVACGGWVIEPTGQVTSMGDDVLDGIRAAARLCWASADAGAPLDHTGLVAELVEKFATERDADLTSAD